MGPNIKKHVQTLGPGILGCCGDAKPALRAAAVTTLNTWVEQAKLHPFIDNEILSDALKVENPNLRTEVCVLNNFVYLIYYPLFIYMYF